MNRITVEEFEQELCRVLTRLYTPDYQPPEKLCTLLGCESGEGTLALQTTLIRAIASLEPPPDMPSNARARRVYDLLHHRFVLQLTQKETADCLCMSRSSIQRAQREAVHTLAGLLWERRHAQGQTMGDPKQENRSQLPGTEVPGNQAVDWRSQVQRELASLRARDPDAVADVADAIASALELIDALVADTGLHAEVKYVQPGLVAAIHPAVLHQLLLTTLKRLTGYMSDNVLAVYARREDGKVRITLTGTIAAGTECGEQEFLRDILAVEDVSIEVRLDGAQVYIWVEVPSIDQVTVLVVDDNPDMALFYRRATLGTPYRIVHIAYGEAVFEVIEAVAPGVIVLDVMLPDIDGWRLLMRLRENPATCPIPVIVCSVVREETLALSLGAAIYLPKPIRPRVFIQTLDQIFHLAAA